MSTTDWSTTHAVAVLLTGSPYIHGGEVLSGEEVVAFIMNEFENIDLYGIAAAHLPLNTTQRLEAGVDVAALSAEVWVDIATAFTCVEAEAIARLLRCFDNSDAAHALLTAQQQADDEGDLHDMPAAHKDRPERTWPRDHCRGVDHHHQVV
jgi:hypothetical protein